MSIESLSSQAVLELQASVLEQIALGAKLKTVLEHLCSLVEEIVPDAVCSIMILHEQLGTLWVAAAPRAADDLVEALNGLKPGHLAGSCGTAVYLGEPVYVCDTAVDPRWASMQGVARKYGIQACWSVPIVSMRNGILGSFAISHLQKCTPEEPHGRLLKTASQLACIAIERARADEALLAAAQKYQELYEHAPDMFVSVDAASRCVVECNQTLLNATGFARDEVIGRPVLDLYHPDCHARVHEARAEFLERGQLEVEDLQLVCKNGARIDVALKVSARRNADGEIESSISVWRDVTEKLRTEEALQRAQKLESLGVMAGGIAHDFNNLLVGVMGNAELAELSLPQGSPAADAVGEIRVAGERASELTEQLMAYAGQGRLSQSSFALSELVRDSVRLMRTQLGRGIEIQQQLEEPSPLVWGDPTQIRQVLLNLLSNAAESLEPETGRVRLSTGVLEAADLSLEGHVLPLDASAQAFAFVEVEDNGCGMDAHTRERIFDPFFTTKSSGHGLGLAASLGVVRRHKGTLSVDSRPGRGSRFRLLLPLTTMRPAEAPEPHIPGPCAKTGLNVLVADDQPMVREVASKMLSAAGHRVEGVDSGSAAIDRVAREGSGFDLVLLDLTMPGLSGEQTYDALRALRPQLPIVFYSGQRSEQDAAQLLLGRSHAAFLRKPFDLERLQRTVQECYERAREEEPQAQSSSSSG